MCRQKAGEMETLRFFPSSQNPLSDFPSLGKSEGHTKSRSLSVFADGTPAVCIAAVSATFAPKAF